MRECVQKKQTKYFMGVDVGSVSTNIVLLNSASDTIVETMYIRTDGQPLNAVYNGLQQLVDKKYANDQILSVGVTGSARTMVGNILGADVVKNEITAHSVAAINQVPDVRTVIEIGGQDSKLILINNGVVTDFAMNTVCAAGTGSFIDQQAFRLKIAVEELGEHALNSQAPARIAGRCTVFAESDMIHKQQLGVKKEDIIAGLCEALVRNFVNNVGKGKKLKAPVIFQGGVAHNKGIIAAFEKELKVKLHRPDNFDVMGALGSAILAKEYYQEENAQTKFRGFGVGKQNMTVELMECSDCANSCEVSKALNGPMVIALWGDRCNKWQK